MFHTIRLRGAPDSHLVERDSLVHPGTGTLMSLAAYSR